MHALRERLKETWLEIALFTVWPRGARVLDPFVGRPPRRVLRNVVLWAAWTFAAREWIGPRARAAAERRERELDELAATLGRKPTHEEIVEDFGRRRAERKAAKGRRSTARAAWERSAAPGP